MKKKLSVRRVAAHKHNSRKHRFVQRGGMQGDQWNVMISVTDYLEEYKLNPLDKDTKDMIVARELDKKEIYSLSVEMAIFMDKNIMIGIEQAWAFANNKSWEKWHNFVSQMWDTVQEQVKQSKIQSQAVRYENVKSDFIKIKYKIYKMLLGLYLRGQQVGFTEEENSWIQVVTDMFQRHKIPFTRFQQLLTNRTLSTLSLSSFQAAMCNTLVGVDQNEDVALNRTESNFGLNAAKKFFMNPSLEEQDEYYKAWLAFVKHMRIMVNNHSRKAIDNIIAEMFAVVKNSQPIEKDWVSKTEDLLDKMISRINLIPLSVLKTPEEEKDEQWTRFHKRNEEFDKQHLESAAEARAAEARAATAAAEARAATTAAPATTAALARAAAPARAEARAATTAAPATVAPRGSLWRECLNCWKPRQQEANVGGGKRKKTSRKKKVIRTKYNRRK